MKKKLTGLIAGGLAHPEIRQGDKWKDSRGNIVIIQSNRFNRVTFIRDGYSGECILPVARFENEFILVRHQTFSEWCETHNTAEKIQNLRALINASRERKE
ncbi:DUF4222 domain-containing protein [Buttiauxella izardii]|uniref:DUF4222 domain-containing protein n=1 Tax=Buttiauxella izardii TaxID=82991 RepID=A0A3A5K9T4_9ENTR|nr:DUF4222 domain-containing protein [Buttiauxella izardii]RJT27690.1 DUF4222 domain-containing protein [Buttiauxella izardii]